MEEPSAEHGPQSRSSFLFPGGYGTTRDNDETVLASLRIEADARGTANLESCSCRALAIQEPLKFILDRTIEIFYADVNDPDSVFTQRDKLDLLQTGNVK